jgi:hypothetical protein
MQRTNYFGRFENKSADAEDRLTRAFLVLVRLIPSVQASFIDSIRKQRLVKENNHVVPSRTETDAGVTGVLSQTGGLYKDEGRVLSIILTSQEWDQPVQVKPSDRTPRYDGVVHYGEQWVFTIENKPYGNVQEYQLHPNVKDAEGLEVDSQPVVLVWEDLIRRLHALDQSDWLDYSEERLVEDFLLYAQEEFPEINPYPTLRHCGDDVGKLNRRCESLMQEIAPGRVDKHRDWRTYIEASELDAAKMVSVAAQERTQGWEIDLVIHPGDTVSQARSLYSNVDTDALLGLTDEWDCSTNLHFSYISKHLVYPSSEISFEKYVEFWRDHMDWIGKVNEESFGELLNLLERNRLMSETDRDEFKAKFFETDRSFAYVCPGISLHYRWGRTEALDLDDNDRLTEKIDERVREAVRAWGAESAWESVLEGA